jgi:hypothetical protein
MLYAKKIEIDTGLCGMQNVIQKALNEHSRHTGEDFIKIHVNVTWCQKSD